LVVQGELQSIYEIRIPCQRELRLEQER
jgi:hypothetical protein